MSEEDKQLSNTVVMPLVTPEQAKEQWASYQNLKSSILTESDFQKIGNNRYTKKSGFRKIATFFGLSDSIKEKTRIDREDGSFYWMITVEAKAPNGRVSQGVGICDSKERNFAHLEHDVYATAHTRAKNRAISDLVAGGEVSAEEMDNREFRESTYDVVAPSRPSKHTVLEYFSLLGYDKEMFTVWEDDPMGIICIKLKRYIDTPEFRDQMRELGANWDKDNKCYVVNM